LLSHRDRFRSDLYWIRLFTGLTEYLETGAVVPSNTYAVFLRDLVEAGKYDPGMKPELDRPERAVARLKHRFDAFLSTFRRKKVSGAPVVVYNAICATALAASGMFESDYFPAHFLVDGHGSRYLAPVVDGYHRLAALYMSGAETEDCIFVWSNLYSTTSQRPRSWSRARPRAGITGRLARLLKRAYASYSISHRRGSKPAALAPDVNARPLTVAHRRFDRCYTETSGAFENVRCD
jgi:hypothetical protein